MIKLVVLNMKKHRDPFLMIQKQNKWKLLWFEKGSHSLVQIQWPISSTQTLFEKTNSVFPLIRFLAHKLSELWREHRWNRIVIALDDFTLSNVFICSLTHLVTTKYLRLFCLYSEHQPRLFLLNLQSHYKRNVFK